MKINTKKLHVQKMFASSAFLESILAKYDFFSPQK